jgi:O-antigen/teichoic acid export membrane protein
MNSDIHKRIAIGAGWMVSLRWADRILHTASIVILARLLLPSDFGLVAYASVFLGILNEFSMFSFRTVLIRDQDTTKDRYHTVWTLEVLKGLALSTVIVASAAVVAKFFNEPKVEAILYWVAVIPILRGFTNIGTVDFTKDLEIHRSFYLNVGSQLLGTIATLILALVLRNYWALVYGWMLRAIFSLVLSYTMCDFRPRPRLTGLAHIFGFSKWMFALNLINSINTRLSAILIGRYFEAQSLAYWNMAQQLSSLASVELAAPIRAALFPGVSKMQGDIPRMTNTLASAVGIILLIGLPITIGVATTAPLFIPLLLGENWIEVVPIIAALALGGAAQLFSPTSHLVYYSLNRPQITVAINALRLCIVVPAMLLVVPAYGAVGAAWLLAAVNCFMLIVDYIVYFRVTHVSLLYIGSRIWRSSVAVLTMAVCVIISINHPISPLIADFRILNLLFSIAVGAISYVGTVAILWWLSGLPDGPESYLARNAKNVYTRLIAKRFSRRP